MITLNHHIHFNEIDSTNSFLLRGNYTHGTIVTSETQTAGRGRKKHKWMDIPHHSFIFSILLKFSDISKLSYLSLVVGLCVVESVKEVYKFFLKNEPDIYIKWPNDILIKKNNQIGKLAGILIESKKNEEWNIIIGIGLNWMGSPQVNDYRYFPPLSLFETIKEKPNCYLKYLIQKMNELSLEEPYDFLSYRDMFLKYHYLENKKVKIQNRIYEIGKVNHQGFLEILDENGNQKYIQDWDEQYELLINH